MYLKFFDGMPIIAPLRMSESDALNAGFKPVTLTEPPETDESHCAVERLEELPDRFIRHWEIEEIPDPEPYEPTDADKAEAYDILMGVET